MLDRESPDPLWPIRLSRWVFVICLALLTAACARDDATHPIGGLNGLFVADPGVHVITDTGWRREGDLGGSFNKTTSLLVWIQGERPDGLRFRFVPDETTSRYHFSASWDGAAVWAEPRAAEDRALVVELGGEGLVQGPHRLQLQRVKELDRPDDREGGRNTFDEVSAELGRDGGWQPHSITTNTVLARFLLFGVTSGKPSRLGGALFLGSQSHAIEIEGGGGREIHFTLDNNSGAEARFSVRVGEELVVEADVRPGGRRPIEVPIPDGRQTVTMTTDGIAGGCFLWGAPFLKNRSPVDRPPVVLITLDTTRVDVISPTSGRPELTPNLHRFVQQATVFTNAYATAPWTLPSHASIFTGLYPSRHRAGVVDDELAPSAVTLAELLREAGYRTAGVIGGSMASSRFGLAQGFDLYRDPRKNQETGDVITEAAVEFLNGDPGLPMFLFLNYFDPHAPYAAPDEFQQRFRVSKLAEAISEVPVWGAYARGERGAWGKIVSGKAPPDDGGLAYLRALYEAEVAFMDHQIGRFFEELKAKGLYDDAMIILVSDHGEFLGERGLFEHSYRLDRELTAVPLLIKWPKQTEARVDDALVSHVDLFPTIAGAAEIEAPSSDGVAIIKRPGPGSAYRESAYMEEHKSRFHQLPGPFKIADHLYGLQRLHDREVFFPGFMECEARTESGWRHAECASDWERRLTELPEAMQESLKLMATDSAADLDEEEAERLRALGYLQ